MKQFCLLRLFNYCLIGARWSYVNEITQCGRHQPSSSFDYTTVDNVTHLNPMQKYCGQLDVLLPESG